MTLRRASNAEPTNSTPTITEAKVRSHRCAPAGGGEATREARVHGPTAWTKTIRPAKAAASSRIGVAARAGTVPVQAFRVSAMSGGVHSGAASVKRSRGQPTASKTTCQSTGPAATGAPCCGGTR